MHNIAIIAAAAFGSSGVMLGAFGAHLLKAKLPAEKLESYETGVRYQLIHAVVLLVLAALPEWAGITTLYKTAVWLFIAGIILFSFSIYGLALQGLAKKKMRFLGPLTPLGGLCLIAGWICLLIAGIKI